MVLPVKRFLVPMLMLLGVSSSSASAAQGRNEPTSTSFVAERCWEYPTESRVFVEMAAAWADSVVVGRVVRHLGTEEVRRRNKRVLRTHYEVAVSDVLLGNPVEGDTLTLLVQRGLLEPPATRVESSVGLRRTGKVIDVEIGEEFVGFLRHEKRGVFRFVHNLVIHDGGDRRDWVLVASRRWGLLGVPPSRKGVAAKLTIEELGQFLNRLHEPPRKAPWRRDP